MSHRTSVLFSKRRRTYSEKILSLLPGIIQYLPLNETSGLTALDASGNGRTGTYSGVTLAQIVGPGLSMGMAGLWDGVNDYLNMFSPSLAAAFNNNAGTIAFWFKVLSFNPVGSLFIFDSADLTANERIYAYLNNTTCHQAWTAAFPDLTLTGDWYHYAVTWSGVTAIRYINGDSPQSISPGARGGTLASMVLGARFTFGNNSNISCSHSVVANVQWTPAQVLIAATAQ